MDRSQILPGQFWSRVMGVMVVVAALTAGAASLQMIVSAPRQDWNDGRLAPSAALLHGYRLYYADGEGPLLGHIYGPVSAFFYLLPMIVARTPSAAIMLGSLLTLLIYLAPASVWTWQGTPGSRLWGSAALVTFWLLPFRSSMLVGPAFNIHADAPALGFGGLACALVVRRDASSSRFAYPLAALFAVLSVGSKQVMVLLPIALLLHVALTVGWRATMRLGVALVLAAAAILLVLALVVDVRAMLFNVLTVPARNPWRGAGGVRILISAFKDLVPRVLPAAAVVAAVAAAEFVSGRLRAGDLRQWLADHPWSLLVILGALNVPLSLLGRAKVGGSANTLAFTGYFIALAAVAALSQAATVMEPVLRRPTSQWAAIVLVAALGVSILRAEPVALSARTLRTETSNDPEHAAYLYALHNPGETYLPFNPLVTLFTEGRAYHFSDAIATRELSGYIVTPRQVADWLPPRMKVVVTRRTYEDYSLRFLSDVTPGPEIPDLPGWKAFTKSSEKAVAR